MSGWKTGDLEPALAGVWTDNGVPASLESAVAVRVHVRKSTRWDTDLEQYVRPLIDRAVTRGDQTTDPGAWSSPLVLDDFDEPGVYGLELEVEWASGRKQTSPTVTFYVAQQIA